MLLIEVLVPLLKPYRHLDRRDIYGVLDAFAYICNGPGPQLIRVSYDNRAFLAQPLVDIDIIGIVIIVVVLLSSKLLCGSRQQVLRVSTEHPLRRHRFLCLLVVVVLVAAADEMVVLEARLRLQVEVSVKVVGRGLLAQDLLLRRLQNDRHLLLREQALLL